MGFRAAKFSNNGELVSHLNTEPAQFLSCPGIGLKWQMLGFGRRQSALPAGFYRMCCWDLSPAAEIVSRLKWTNARGVEAPSKQER